MQSNEVRVGQKVQIAQAGHLLEGRIFTVLDRAPRPAHWWLQCDETGRVDEGWSFHPSAFEIVSDSPTRNLPIVALKGEGNILVQYSLGEWGLVRLGSSAYRIVHLPLQIQVSSGIEAMFKSQKAAKEVMAELNEKCLPYSPERLHYQWAARVGEVYKEAREKSRFDTKRR